VRRVEDVDVDRHVHRCVADAFGDAFDDAVRAEGRDVAAGDHREAEAGVLDQILAVVDRSPHPDVHVAVEEQALLVRPPERRSVGDVRAVEAFPGVEVSVEVHQCHRAVHGVRGAQ
jgi:hypothetical protein